MMSTTRKSIIFLAIAFAVAWGVVGAYWAAGIWWAELRAACSEGVVGACWAAGMHESPQARVIALALSMTGPAIGALVCAFAFEKGRRVEVLGLRFKPNWWWLAAWLAPIAIVAGSVALTVLLSDRAYVDIGSAVAAVAAAQGQDLSQAPAFLTSTAFLIGVSIFAGALINMVILTLTEELGWRGYLHHLWRPAGFWRASLATGAVWGFWHAPAIYLFGLNYPDHPLLGVALFIPYCMLLAPIFTLIRDRSGSVWAAGLMHGTFNAIGGLSLAAISNPTFPWNGIVGIGGFLALGIAVVIVALLQRPKQEAL